MTPIVDHAAFSQIVAFLALLLLAPSLALAVCAVLFVIGMFVSIGASLYTGEYHDTPRR